MDSLPLPPTELRFMREDDDRLIRTGRELARLLQQYGMKPDSTVLDVGSGYGRLALGLLTEGLHRGRYIGFDVLPKHVGWCREHLTALNPRLEFHHIDARNSRYNPTGSIDPDRLRFPTPIGSIDVAAAFSVFTHLYRTNVEHYLAELRRVLRPGGVAITTWLLWSDERLPALVDDGCAYPMRFQIDRDTRTSDEADPLRAIGFRLEQVLTWVMEADLRIRLLAYGSWDGVTASESFQDLMVMERPDGPLRRARWLAGRAKRRVQKTFRRGAPDRALRPETAINTV
ncbi:MAG TPA: class I SAM-dependent methyltransferase [Acidimicrobiia bacterium]|jgi:SAM-dependent methyltransferase